MKARRRWWRWLGMAIALALLVAAMRGRGEACLARSHAATALLSAASDGGTETGDTRSVLEPPVGAGLVPARERATTRVAPTKRTAAVRGSWVLWNTSESLPRGPYLRVDGPLVLGAIVAACLPEEIALVARERGYVPPGSRCPGRVAPLLKRVAAVEGMWVERLSEVISIEGQRWPGGEIERYDSRGRLVPWQVACPYLVPEGHVLLLGERAGSFDGRYFGPVSEGAVLGVYRNPLIPSPSPAGGRREPESAASGGGEGRGRPRPLAGEGRGEGR